MPRKYTVTAAVIERNKNSRAAQLSLDNYVRKIVARAPELTEAQKAILRPLLSEPDGGSADR
ncbi:hypothetical protein [Streptomyces sp. GESEQ-35]|uniref:hypothetical protein n=1 Tax=Streptomyces sp. GESEQ-35 TaxID=2812657 RepID=UPI001B318AE1|nr:hypothetical protein [Streptomyces sp. GESEQ-35]